MNTRFSVIICASRCAGVMLSWVWWGFARSSGIATLLTDLRYTTTSTLEISRESNKSPAFQGVEREVSVADQEFYQTNMVF